MILLVQLHSLTRHRTAEILRNAGYEVQEADNGPDAFSLLNKHHFDLVITDVLLPAFDGVDVASKVRLAWPDMPIIFTGYMPPIGADAILKQPLGFVFQPINRLELLSSVRRLYPQPEDTSSILIEVRRN